MACSEVQQRALLLFTKSQTSVTHAPITFEYEFINLVVNNFLQCISTPFVPLQWYLLMKGVLCRSAHNVTSMSVLTEMYAGHVACCTCESRWVCWRDRRTAGRMPHRYITLYARRGRRNKRRDFTMSSFIHSIIHLHFKKEAVQTREPLVGVCELLVSVTGPFSLWTNKPLKYDATLPFDWCQK